MQIKQSSGAIIIAITILFMACDVITDVRDEISDAYGSITDMYDSFTDTYGDITDIIADMPPATPTEIPPFVITKPVFEITERTNYFKYAGIVFKFFNMAEEYVDRITVSFMIFDPKTQSNPFITTNKFEIRKWDFVFPYENKEILISLDKYIYIAPAEPYLIDFFYISEIHYINGGVWQDKNGKYRIRGVN